MRRNDTIDRGPNKLLIKDWDAQAYFKHRKRVSDTKSRIDFGSGKHIVRISPHGPRHNRLERANEIMHANRVLYDRISEVLERPAYKKEVMYDSKTIAAKAQMSPIALNQTLKSDVGSMYDTSTAKLMIEGQEDKDMMLHESHLLLPQTKNFIMPKRLTVSPRRMKVFHGHQIGGDNTVQTDLQSNKRQIQVGQNMVRIMHNQRQDHSERVMKENHRMLQRLLQTEPLCCDPKELSKRDNVLDKRNDIASQHPLKTTCFDRQKRLKSVSLLRKDGSPQRSGSVTRRHKVSNQSLISESVMASEFAKPIRDLNAMSELNVGQVPHTTRNRDTTGMGMTQPVFPKVADQLNRTSDTQAFESITYRDNQNAMESHSQFASVDQQQVRQQRMPFQQHRTIADLNALRTTKIKKNKRRLEPLASVPAGIKMRKHSLQRPIGMINSPIGMSQNKFAIKKRSVNALSSSRNDTTNFAMTSTHMSMSEASRSNQQNASPRAADSMFRVTDSSYPFLQESQAQAGAISFQSNKTDLKVFTLPNEPVEESSQKRLNRLTIYRARVVPDDSKLQASVLDLQRDLQVKNRLFVILQEEDGLGEKRELFITLKQATNLLIKAKHDFKVFCEELLYVKHGTIAARNMSFQVFDPTQGNYAPAQQLLNQSSSNQLNFITSGEASPNAFIQQPQAIKQQDIKARTMTHMIPEEEYPPSKSVTENSQRPPESKAETSERDFIRDMEREEMKRRTQQIVSPRKQGQVSFQDAINSDEHSYLQSRAPVMSNEAKKRPRIEQVMMSEFTQNELHMDLSETVSQTITATEEQTEILSKVNSAGIVEEESTQGPIQSTEPPAAIYHDFLDMKQARVSTNEEMMQVQNTIEDQEGQTKA